MLLEEATAWAVKVASALKRGNTGIFDEEFSHDFIQHGTSGDCDKETLKTVFEKVFTAFSNLEKTVEDVAVNGNCIWARCRVTGTHTGTYFGFPPTNKTFSFTTIDIWRLKKGKCVEHWGVEDRLGLLQQIGAIKH